MIVGVASGGAGKGDGDCLPPTHPPPPIIFNTKVFIQHMLLENVSDKQCVTYVSDIFGVFVLCPPSSSSSPSLP